MPKRNGPGIELLADPTRRRIIAILAIRPWRPSALARAIGLSRPATTRQLRLLRAAGLLRASYSMLDGRAIVYQIDPDRHGADHRLAGRQRDRTSKGRGRPTGRGFDGSGPSFDIRPRAHQPRLNGPRRSAVFERVISLGRNHREKQVLGRSLPLARSRAEGWRIRARRSAWSKPSRKAVSRETTPRARAADRRLGCSGAWAATRTRRKGGVDEAKTGRT